MDQTSIEHAILSTSDQLEEATRDLAELTESAALAEAEYKRKYAVTFLSLQDQEGTVAVKEQRAYIQCLVEYQAMRVAESQVKSQQELCRTLRARLDAFRTVSANVRSAGG